MALIAWDNLVERAATVLQPPFPGNAAGLDVQQWRVPVGSAASALQSQPGVTTLFVQMDFPAASKVRAICLPRTNLTPAAQIQVVTPASYFLGSAGVVAGVGQALYVFPAAVNVNQVQLTITDPGNPDGFLNLPLCFVGDGVEFPIQPDSEPGRDVRRNDAQSRGGTVLTDALSSARSWSIRSSIIEDADLQTWLPPLEAAAGFGRNILFIPRLGSSAPAEAVLGLLTSGRSPFVDEAGLYRTWSATIAERL